MKPSPPELPRKLFEWIAGRAAVEDLLGDLDEIYSEEVDRTTPIRAKWMYWKQSLSLIFSYALRKRKRDASYSPYSTSTFPIDMLRNYLKVALRNLYQYRYFSTLNIFGLALGMSISLLLISIYSYVSTYDNFHQNKERIYSIVSHVKDGVEEAGYATAPVALAHQLKKEYSGVEEVVTITKSYHDVRTENQNIPFKAFYVGAEFLEVFSFNLINGSSGVLTKPGHVVLTETSALKLFNSKDVIGKTLEIEGGVTLQVGALLQDPPRNTHFDFDMLVAASTMPNQNSSVETQWARFSSQYVYLLMNEGVDTAGLQQHLDAVSTQMYATLPVKVSFDFRKLKEVVMGPDLRHTLGVTWEASGFLMFGVFAAMILLPACFNYTNISIARALRRSREIGVRKTMGGLRQQIFFQFITETVVIALIALFGSLLIFVVIRDEFQSMMVAGAALDLSLSPRLVLWFTGFALLTGFAAGCIPALYFARLNPIEALRSKINGRGSSMRLRRILNVFQFALSFGFILSLVVFNRQYQYSRGVDLGFHKENTIDVELQGVNPELAKNVFSNLPSVKSVSLSSGLLGVGTSRTWIKTGEQDSAEVAQMFVDENYISSFGLTLLAGQNFLAGDHQRERHLIVNEEFLKGFKISNPRDALSLTFDVDGEELSVIGVVKNFHYEPLTEPVGKFFFRMKPAEFSYLNLQVASTDAFTTFSELEEAWKTLPTQARFKGRYFEDELEEAYSSYVVLLKVVGFLGLLAITISLLGMLGMVVYTTESRTKEVSIRKVMGATVGAISLLLSKEYLKMMAWAILFAVPITGWLLSFLLPQISYYNVQLSVWDVLISVVILVSLGVLTIASQTYKTARTNPALTLRME